MCELQLNRNKKKIAYIWEQDLIELCDKLPAVKGRASMVHSLITAYGILDQIKIIRSIPATYSELKFFHSELYLDHLKTFTDIDEDYFPSAVDEEYGFGYGCQPVSDLYNISSAIAGASLTAAKCLLLNAADVVINWNGGWHHAHRFGAEGFCYVNDIVIAMEKLKLKFPKILYVDLDVHHGDGVQDAYEISKTVFTLSFHLYEPGFYPGTGGLKDIGRLNGKGFACNVPLQGFYSDQTFKYMFECVFTMAYSHYMPDVIVVQCGADALAMDPKGGAGLTIDGYSYCLRRILDKMKPTMLLGGGGYDHSKTARLWTSLTALACDIQLDENIPEHDFWPSYGPDYTLAIQPPLAKDFNTNEYIDYCIKVISGNLHKYLVPEEPYIEGPIIKRRKVHTDSDSMQVDIHGVSTSKLNLNSDTQNEQIIPKDPYEFVD